MSGVEVAGLVLGVLPLLIQGAFSIMVVCSSTNIA